MKCSFVRIFTALIFGIIAFTFSPFGDSFGVLLFGSDASEPSARLFQILFFLFIISPPLIVVLLYLIWQELKTRNKMK
jgi:membrane protease YdiL (CAAX protease family)